MQRLSYPSETVLSNKITKNIIVLSFKDSPRKPLRRGPSLAELHNNDDDMMKILDIYRDAQTIFTWASGLVARARTCTPNPLQLKSGRWPGQSVSRRSDEMKLVLNCSANLLSHSRDFWEGVSRPSLSLSLLISAFSRRRRRRHPYSRLSYFFLAAEGKGRRDL